MLNLYQMMDPNFMSHLEETGGQLFVRDVNEDLMMVVGLISKTEKIRSECQYFVKIEFDTTTCKNMKEQAKGQSMGGMFRQNIWGGGR